MNEVKVPILCCPNDPDEAKFLSEVAGTKIDEALENLGGLRSGIFWPAKTKPVRFFSRAFFLFGQPKSTLPPIVHCPSER